MEKGVAFPCALGSISGFGPLAGEGEGLLCSRACVSVSFFFEGFAGSQAEKRVCAVGIGEGLASECCVCTPRLDHFLEDVDGLNFDFDVDNGGDFDNVDEVMYLEDVVLWSPSKGEGEVNLRFSVDGKRFRCRCALSPFSTSTSCCTQDCFFCGCISWICCDFRDFNKPSSPPSFILHTLHTPYTWICILLLLLASLPYSLWL